MSESTKEAIRIARANGHICMINTGRTKRLVGENLTGQVEFDGLLLGCGTEIEFHGKQLMHKTFSMEESKAILAAMKKISCGCRPGRQQGRLCSQRRRSIYRDFPSYGT